MWQFDPQQYGPACSELLSGEPPEVLEPGAPNTAVLGQLRALKAGDLLSGRVIADPDMAQCCLAGLWLRHNFLEESHSISQSIHTPSGSYWHGILHRREPDYSNAKYWFRRVGQHPIFGALCQFARPLARMSQTPAAQTIADQSQWDPFHFVDCCASAVGGDAEQHGWCVSIARLEWELLFDHCYQRAVEA